MSPDRVPEQGPTPPMAMVMAGGGVRVLPLFPGPASVVGVRQAEAGPAMPSDAMSR